VSREPTVGPIACILSSTMGPSQSHSAQPRGPIAAAISIRSLEKWL